MEELHEQPASEPAQSGPERVMRHKDTAAHKKIEALQAQLSEAQGEIRRLKKDLKQAIAYSDSDQAAIQMWKSRYERLRMLWVVQWYWNAVDAWNRARDPHTYRALWSRLIDFESHKEKLTARRDAVVESLSEYSRRIRLAAYVLKTGSFA